MTDLAQRMRDALAAAEQSAQPEDQIETQPPEAALIAADDSWVELTPDEKKELAAQDELKREIKWWEERLPKRLELLDNPPVLPIVPVNGSLEDKLNILRERDRILTDALKEQERQEEQAQDIVKPKYGHGLAVSIEFKDGFHWLDSTATDVDTGVTYKLSPGLRAELDKKLDELRAEKANEVAASFDSKPEPHSRYLMTQEDYERESEKDFPVYPLPRQAGPNWDDSILYGPVGDVIRKASEYNESHPAGMLVDFLVSIGSQIGRGPYFTTNATKHYTNEFMIRVGASSKSRKGSGRDAIDEILKLVDSKWYSNCIESGFGSGEAIVNRIRDEIRELKHNPRTNLAEVRTIPGVDDKRLCVREGEAASILVLAAKPESRADIVIRDGWDGKPLHNVVKGKTREGFSNSTKCDEPHLSISADTTISELRQKMPTGAENNGFGNRFLYVYVYRMKDCPQGGPSIDWTKEILYFHQVIQFAKGVKYVSMSNQARKWWNNYYSEVERETLPGLAGKMTDRGAAHVRRLAMLYALLDKSDVIELHHFKAAKQLWDYCEESALFIFGGFSKEQLKILQWLETRGAVTFKQLRDELYNRHRRVEDIRADLDGLVKAGKLIEADGVYDIPQRYKAA